MSSDGTTQPNLARSVIGYCHFGIVDEIAGQPEDRPDPHHHPDDDDFSGIPVPVEADFATVYGKECADAVRIFQAALQPVDREAPHHHPDDDDDFSGPPVPAEADFDKVYGKEYADALRSFLAAQQSTDPSVWAVGRDVTDSIAPKPKP